MAKEKKESPKTVNLVAPSGTKVTVSEEQAKVLKSARGYTSASK